MAHMIMDCSEGIKKEKKENKLKNKRKNKKKKCC